MSLPIEHPHNFTYTFLSYNVVQLINTYYKFFERKSIALSQFIA